ncbi:MAG: 4-hydroxybenzoate octaprenyltransferase, partial [Marinilabiliales bacterium]
DKDIDKKNPRTAVREIPSGIIKSSNALIFVAINSILFVVAAGLINWLVFALSPIALLVVLGYSFTKRFTALCHFILGLGLSLAPIGAYLSVTGHFDVLPILLSIAVLTWTAGFDIIYALQDYSFDNHQKLKSIPVRLGQKGALTISVLSHTITAILIFVVVYFSAQGILAWIGAGIFFILLIYQHLIVKPNDLSKVNMAFFTLNGIASIVFAAFLITDMYFKI